MLADYRSEVMEPDELVKLLRETQPNASYSPPHSDEHGGDPELDRAWVCLMLAPTPEIWFALLDNQPVATWSLDQDWYHRFRQLGIV